MSPDTRPTSQGTDRNPARSLLELLRSFATDAASLVRQEIALARAELRLTAVRLAGAAGRVAAGAGLAGLGALTLLAGLVVLLGQLIGSYWLSALIVGVVLLLGGGWTAFNGIRRVRAIDPAPRLTIESLESTAAWARAEAAGVKAALLGRGGGGAWQAESRVLAPAPGAPAALQPERSRHGEGGQAVALSTQGRAPAPPPAAASSGRAPREPPTRQQGTVAFLKHVWGEIREDEITGHAAKLAYYSFLALPPALMALFGLAGLIGSGELAAWIEEQASLALPGAVSETIVTPFIEQVVLEKAPGPFSVGLLLALWGGSSVFLGLIDTLNHAYDIEESRSFLRKRGLAVAAMVGSVFLFGGAALTLLVGPAVVDALGLGPVGTFLWNVAQYPIAFLFMVAAFWGAYYFLPNRDQRGRRRVLVKAAALAAGLWVLATAGFRIYIANFSSYSETYGFLGAFIILLLWLYVTGLVVLAGGELASEMEKRASA
jgi:membrane protein